MAKMKFDRRVQSRLTVTFTLDEVRDVLAKSLPRVVRPSKGAQVSMTVHGIYEDMIAERVTLSWDETHTEPMPDVEEVS